MAASSDLADTAAEPSTAYAHYVLRAAAYSVRTLHLYEQLIGCVARRQLAPAALRESLTDFLQERGGDPSLGAEELMARFFAGLATMTFLPADAADPPPDFDPADVLGSFQRVAEHAATRNEQALQAYQSTLAQFAAGEMTAGQFRRAVGPSYGSEIGRVARLWFDLLADLEGLRARFAEEYLLGALRNANPIGFDAEVIDLAAPIGTTTSTVLSLENLRDERTVVHCAVSDVRRADGIGPAFMPDIAVTPAELLLDRRRAAGIRLSLRLDETVYEAGAPYIGALQISRDGEPPLDVPLRITATARDRP
jgi:hypothetical protein